MNDAELTRAAAGVVLPSFAGLDAPLWILRSLADGLAGVVLFGHNIADRGQLTSLCAQLRAARSDLVIAIDEEGGDVTRLAHRSGSPYPGNAALGAADDTALTKRVYRALGAELADAGITLDLAPSVDVNTAADNPVIGTRAFGSTAELVAAHGAAAVTGLQEAGVAACAKHFPGHGATREDSHLALPTVDVPLALLRERELRPFAAAVAAGVAAIMTAHVRVPALTGDLPATRSPAALQDLLRGELGFGGAVVTDALDMAGAGAPSPAGSGAPRRGLRRPAGPAGERHGRRGRSGVPEVAAASFVAGADLLCLGPGPGHGEVAATVAAVAAAVWDGRVPFARLEAARARIAGLARRGAGTPTPADGDAGMEAARAAVRMRGAAEPLSRPLVVELQAPAAIAAGPVPWGMAPWLLAAHDGGEVVAVEQQGARPDDLLARATGRSLVVVLRDAHRHPWMVAVVETLLAARPDAVVVEMGLPLWQPRHPGAYLATYGAARANAAAATELLVRQRAAR